MPRDNDLLILGGIALAAWLLLGRNQGQTAAAAPQVAGPTSTGTDCGGYGCNGGGGTVTPPSAAPTNTFCQGGQILREGVCINPASSAPRLGSEVNDATLAMLIREQERYMAVGNWDMAWQIAAKRDAWIKQQGY